MLTQRMGEFYEETAFTHRFGANRKMLVELFRSQEQLCKFQGLFPLLLQIEFPLRLHTDFHHPSQMVFLHRARKMMVTLPPLF